MPKIFDNIENYLVECLNYTLDVSHRADFCVGYFNLRGWKQVADKIDAWEGGEGHQCRLLVGMQKGPEELLREHFWKREEEPIDLATATKIRKSLASEFKDQLTFGIPTEEDEKGLRRLSAQIKNKQVIVKLFLRHPLHAKLYLLFRDDKINPVIGYVGSSNLTLAGLKKQGELNVDVLEQDAATKLSDWFNDRWEDRWCVDISADLVEAIDTSWATETVMLPYYVYLKIAYHLSREAIAGITQFKIPNVFQHELLEFQQKAVLIAAHHINDEKRGGVMIGDVVGFGKTITATAIAKILEEDFFLETLIICPKNLVRMWKDYVHKYRLRADVLSISNVQSVLPKERRYRVVLIDESHNLRNREGKRYRAIQEYILLNESKVILLTGTPYNKTYTDLSNQLRLFVPEDRDLGIGPEHYIERIGGPVEFMARHQCATRSLQAFEKSESADDWRELMRMFMIRRTRSFIKDNYAIPDPNRDNRKYLKFTDGRRFYFPDRIPRKVEYDFDSDDPKDQYARLYSQPVVDIINSLNLARYGLGKFISEHPPVTPTRDETVVIDNLSRAGKRLMGFCRTNLFKRLESSGYSFLLSLSRHILRNLIYVYAIDNKLSLPIGPQESNLLDEFLDDEDPDRQNEAEVQFLVKEADYFEQAKKIYRLYETAHQDRLDWIRAELFKPDLKKSLIEDARALLKIMAIAKSWNADEDKQLKALLKLCSKDHPNDKVLIFTQFADTAIYLADQLKRLGLTRTECVTGDSEDPTEYAYRFSPMSNEHLELKGSSGEIRILVSTDVLSEGQNLQDGHIIVNYDLPWALIRLIQRAGRVDRIGQESDKVLCYSFLPEDGLEKIIALRSRLRRRIEQNAEVVGSDEVFFEGDPVNIADLYNEKAGILDEEDDGEVDLASYAYQIWKNATDANSELKKIIPSIPDVTYATKANSSGEKSKNGVVVYTRSADDNDILTWVDDRGQVITQSQLTILKAAECGPGEPPLKKIENHHKLVESALSFAREAESSIGGQLGKKTGAKYRTYMRLASYYEANKDTLFVNEALKRAIDEVYKYPLREGAKDTLNRQLKAGIDDAQLADLVVGLRAEDKLCLINEAEIKQRDPQIICSLGLKTE